MAFWNESGLEPKEHIGGEYSSAASPMKATYGMRKKLANHHLV